MSFLAASLAIIVGFVGLIWSSDKFVLGASSTARNFGVSPLIIGLTIVAFGTSAPEIFSSASASIRGVPYIAVGNALGSNIANLGLVLAITVLLCPIAIPESILKKELPALFLVTAACFIVFADMSINWIDGILLLGILAIFTWRLSINRAVLAEQHMVSSEQVIDAEEVTDYIQEMSTTRALLYLFMGLVLLIISANVLVTGAIEVARALGVSELVIGLTIIAIGTSLPELAASITSAVKGHHDLVLGNIIGSNIMNILLVLPVPAFISPMNLDAPVLYRDYSTMAFITLLAIFMLYINTRQQRKIGRLSGSILLIVYFAYTALLFTGS